MTRPSSAKGGPIVLLLLLGLALGQMPAPTPKDAGLHLEELMSAAEFRASGLNKLSPQELAHLDSWLNSFANRLVASVGEQRALRTPDVIESRIDGEFHGWDGETIFKLENGQIWQQAEYDYTYEYAYRPEATIFKTAGCYKLQVEDVDEKICVKRIK